MMRLRPLPRIESGKHSGWLILATCENLQLCTDIAILPSFGECPFAFPQAIACKNCGPVQVVADFHQALLQADHLSVWGF